MSNSIRPSCKDRWFSDAREIPVEIVERDDMPHGIYILTGTLPMRVYDNNVMSMIDLRLLTNDRCDILDWAIEPVAISADVLAASSHQVEFMTRGNSTSCPTAILHLLHCLDAYLATFPGYIKPDEPLPWRNPRVEDAAYLWNWRESDLQSALQSVAAAYASSAPLVADLLTVDELNRVMEKFYVFQWPILDRPME